MVTNVKLYKYGCELAVIKEQFCNPTRYVVCTYQSNKFYILKKSIISVSLINIKMLRNFLQFLY
jgi:hypothetical protein